MLVTDRYGLDERLRPGDIEDRANRRGHDQAAYDRDVIGRQVATMHPQAIVPTLSRSSIAWGGGVNLVRREW
jgi:hypothetical protein